ncbi:acyl-CoA thioester hydrolase/BAAT C-terminal domain-containing protein [Corticicoccus populi]|uniref:Acyl-CoA thioester hydrolase/BAAT C-terminal domain-containing protein n=1 Tax=Corticicoccus populi TaxID=1812821 RepID=A0ABW5WU11_9STAP
MILLVYIEGLKEEVFIDEDLKLRIKNCPEELITIITEMKDDNNKIFKSVNEYMPNNNEVNLDEQSPVKGDYYTADSNGILWSMKEKAAGRKDYFEKNNELPILVSLRVMAEGKVLYITDFKLIYYRKPVRKLEYSTSDRKGLLFEPKKGGEFPAVILLSGSDGGCKAESAAYLASHNFLVYALPYFNSENLPKNLENIPLEYFKEATEYLKNHERCDGNVHLVGYSKGAELALLLGSVYDDYKSIIAGAPGAYITSGMREGVFAPVKSWTLDGVPLPYLKTRFSPSLIFKSFTNYFRNKPMSFLEIWTHSLKKSSKLKNIMIDVENISCPIMLISGADDQLWPSSAFSELIRTQRTHPKDIFLDFQDAGHFIAFPYSFVNIPVMSFMQSGKMTLNFGGNDSSNVHAVRTANPTIVDFLVGNS